MELIGDLNISSFNRVMGDERPNFAGVNSNCKWGVGNICRQLFLKFDHEGEQIDGIEVIVQKMRTTEKASQAQKTMCSKAQSLRNLSLGNYENLNVDKT